MVGGLASGGAPRLGGILAGTLGRRWLFGVNVPVDVVGLLMVWPFVTVGRVRRGCRGVRLDRAIWPPPFRCCASRRLAAVRKGNPRRMAQASCCTARPE